MKCPYCNGEMEQGYLQSSRPVFWSRKNKQVFTVPSASRGDISLTKYGWNCSKDKAYLCRSCKKIVIDLN
ncbi:MAG: PF20097 family protein [Burkholderiales bacterium]